MTNLTFSRGNNTIDAFRRDMDRLFASYFNTGYNTTDNTNWAPACELLETDKTYVLKAELPGCNEKDIDVQVATNQLSIRGERKTEWDENKGAFHFSERTYGTFFRNFTLPNTVDTTKIRARYDRGILEIEMPKTTTATLTKVKVELK